MIFEQFRGGNPAEASKEGRTKKTGGETRQGDNNLEVVVKGRKMDLKVNLTPSEALVTGEELKGLATRSVDKNQIGDIVGTKGEEDYVALPPESIPPEERTRYNKGRERILTPRREFANKDEASFTDTYVKTGGFIREKLQSKFDKDGKLVGTIETDHDDEGLPTGVKHTENNMTRGRVFNEFDPATKRVKKTTKIEYDEKGQEKYIEQHEFLPGKTPDTVIDKRVMRYMQKDGTLDLNKDESELPEDLRQPLKLNF